MYTKHLNINIFFHIYLVTTSFLDVTTGKIFFSPKTVSILQYKMCDNPSKSTWKGYIGINKFNRTLTVVNGNLTLTEDLDDSLIIQLEVRRWGDGGWKHNFIKFEKNNACSTFLLAFGNTAKSILDGAGIKSKCPIVKNTYRIKDTYIDMSKNSFALFGGKFWAVFKLKTRRNEVKLCTDTILQIDDMF